MLHKISARTFDSPRLDPPDRHVASVRRRGDILTTSFSLPVFVAQRARRVLAWTELYRQTKRGDHMRLPDVSRLSRRFTLAGVALIAALSTGAPPARAKVVRIVIDTKASPDFGGASFGTAGRYETLAGRVFGELDPFDKHNDIINDIELAPRNSRGKIEYMATFFLVKPMDMSKSSHLMWQDVPNRGGRITLAAPSRNDGDIGLSSGWQGDNSGDTAHDLSAGNDWAVVPIPTGKHGEAITGVVMGRILNPGGVMDPNAPRITDSSPIVEHSNPLAYKPISLDTRQSTLEYRDFETSEGVVIGRHPVAAADWAWAHCDATHAFPGTPSPTEICVRGGFVPAKVYQVVFKSQDPYILTVGTAAFRDAASFFKYETQDSLGNPNPLAAQGAANGVKWVITRGSSQSGTFIRQLIHFGFTQDEANRKVYDGAWPIVAARRIALNFRFAKPDLVMKLYEAGSEGPLWWERWPDRVRGLPTKGILDRCRASNTCPKIVEHFGAAEAWGQKLTTGWVGTDAQRDIPLPENVRRYYFASSPHGGGAGGFSTSPGNIPNCSSNNYGPGTFGSNPLPQTQTVNALRFHFRNWVMQGTRPPDSVYPKLNSPARRGDDDDDDDGDGDGDGEHEHGKRHRHGEHHASPDLVPPSKPAMGFPTLPAVLASANPDAPNSFIQAMLQYDWGHGLDYSENIGFHSFEPPIIRRVIKQVVPRVDADGNEIGGVPVVLLQAPLGTYLGWNITATGFHKGQVCNYQGGWIPFAKTKAERVANNDPRPSLEERYVSHGGYVAAVTAAAARTVATGFLLQADADALIAAAAASNVLNP